MVSEEEFIKLIINLIYQCKFSKKEWDESSVIKVYEWLDIFQIKFLDPFKEFVHGKEDTYLKYTLKVWDDAIEEYSKESKLPKLLDLDLSSLLDGSLNLKEYVFNSWINNLNITENKFKIFLNNHIDNISKSSSNNNDYISNSLINSFKEIIANNSFNSILIEYNKSSLNQLQNNLKLINYNNSDKIKTSLIYNIELLLYKNDNIKKKASAQLFLKHFIKLQKEYNNNSNNNNINQCGNNNSKELNQEIINILDKLFSEESTSNIFSWILLIIFEKEINRKQQKQHFQQQINNNVEKNINKLIYNGIITLIDQAKKSSKILYFLKSDKELLIEISKYDQEFFKSYYISMFSCLDYYLFNSKSKSIDPVYLNSISDALKQLNQIDSIIQNQVNQRLLGTKFLKMNDSSKERVLDMLINFKISNSKVIT